MAVVSRLELNHPALGTAGGSSLHASIEALYEKIGDALSSRWFSLADFDQAETVDLDHNFLTDQANLQIDLMNFVGGKWVKLTDQTSPSTADFTIIEKVGDEKAVLQITNDTGGNDLTFAVSISFQPIYLSDGDVKDVVLTSAGEGHSLVFDDASKAFVNDSTAALKLPVGTTAQRPTPVDGHVRYNSDLVRYEGYKSGAWGELGGGGAGGKNYILNPDAAVDATSDVSNTATIPGSWSIERTTTAAELPEETKGTAFKISGSTLTVGDTVEFAIEATGIDDADGGTFGRAKVSVLDISGSINGEYKIQVYNVTDSVYVGDEDTITGTGTYYLDVPLVATNDYEFHLKAATASPTNIGLSGITIEPVSQTTASLQTKWQSYTPSNTQGFGTITNVELEWRINGQNVEIRGGFTCGTVTASEAQIELPNSYTIAQSGSSTQLLGEVMRDGNITNGYYYSVATNGDTYINFTRNAAGSAENGLTPSSGNNIFATSVRISLEEISIPVAELANAHTPTASDVQYENARGRFYNLSGGSYTSGNAFPWNTDSTDLVPSGLSNSGGVITAESAGDYQFHTYISATASLSCFQDIYINGGFYKRVKRETTDTSISASWIAHLEKDDTMEVRLTASFTVSGGESSTWLDFSRVPEYSARKVSLPFPNGTVRLDTGNGRGGTNTTVRRFTNSSVTGDAFTYADSPADGMSITANRDMLVSAYYSDVDGSTFQLGIVVNGTGTDLTTSSPLNIAASKRRASGEFAANFRSDITTPVFKVNKGDIIRAQQNNVAYNDGVDVTTFHIEEVYRLGN